LGLENWASRLGLERDIVGHRGSSGREGWSRGHGGASGLGVEEVKDVLVGLERLLNLGDGGWVRSGGLEVVKVVCEWKAAR
jgi:hypothetical protein